MVDYYTKSILVLGCGNILFGDDGFGPKVIEYLQKNYQIPEDVCLLNVGSSAREVLFDISLSETKPKKIIIVDAVDVAKRPGEIFELSVDGLPENKIDDFSMHQLPTSNLLKELKKFCNIDVRIVSCQVENIPKEVRPGISNSLLGAIPNACERILKLIKEL